MSHDSTVVSLQVETWLTRCSAKDGTLPLSAGYIGVRKTTL